MGSESTYGTLVQTWRIRKAFPEEVFVLAQKQTEEQKLTKRRKRIFSAEKTARERLK